MTELKLGITIALLLLFAVHSVPAQDLTGKTMRAATGPVITGAASAERVRFTAPNTIVQMHLQIYGDSGELLFDVAAKGNALDWTLQDGGGKRLDVGSYVCVVTVKSISGKLSQRVGSVAVHEGRIELRGVVAGQLTGAQQQAVGPVEENGVLTILKAGEAAPVTLVANDGRDGQLIRGRGALSFRLGDFFTGTDREQMRLTEDGRLGIGTDKPEATLDVAGDIRARGGIRFPDGTTLLSAANAPGSRLDSSGDPLPGPSAAGTGTLNRLAKWAETGGAGTLTNSTFEEDAAGNVFNFTGTRVTAPGQQPFFEAQRGSSGDIFQRFWNTGAGGAKLRYVAGAGATSQIQLTDANEWLSAIAGNNSVGLQFRVRGAGTTNSEATLDQSAQVTIARSGNVGVGTQAPAAKLDVVGDVNTSTQYRVGGQRVMSIFGTVSQPNSNTFVGVSAGPINPTTGDNNSFFGFSAGRFTQQGGGNSFFGAVAGIANFNGSDNSFFGVSAGTHSTGHQNSFFGRDAGYTTNSGHQNSFFGKSSGYANTSGNFNSFFGFGTGTSNTTESFNTFIGYFSDGAAGITNATAIGNRAQVTQSDSLVLGSIANVNAAMADTNVGIGTTAPKSKLQVTNGDIFVSTPETGLILKTPGGNCFRIYLNDGPQMIIEPVGCPDH